MEADSVLDLAAATSTAGLVAWSLDPVSREIVWSAGFEAVFGIDRELARWRDDWAALCHPDDIEAVVEAAREAVRTGQTFSTIHRVVLATGTRWVESVGGLVGSGPDARLTGVMRDITDRLDEEANTLTAAAEAQTALHLIGAVSWAWDLHAGTVAIEIYGERAWTNGLPQGIVSESEFFDLIETTDHTSLREFARAVRKTGVFCHRLARDFGGHAVRSHWISHSDRSGRVARVVGVTISAGH